MTAVAGHVSSGRPAPAPLPAGVPAFTGVPRLADGVELLGEYKDSGYSQPPSLVRRPDGQVIQISALLYQVICRIDGARGPAAIAELVSADLGRILTAEQAGYLITAKLLPLGIVADPAATAAPPTANPLLALRARGTLLPERAANAAGTLLRPLFRWPVIVAVAGSVLAVDWWLFAITGWAEDSSRCCVTRWTCWSCSACRRFPPCSTSAGTRPDAGMAARGPAWSASASTWSGRRSSPTSPTPTGCPARARCDRPGRPVLQRGLHAGPGRHLRSHLQPDPAAGHRRHPSGDAGAAAPLHPLRRLLHPQRPSRRAGPIRPRRSHPAQRRGPGRAGTRA